MAAVEAGSLTAAAVALGTTPSVVSRSIARLEQHLGVPLLHRTTRSLGLTEAGRGYLEKLRQAFGLIDEAERGIQGLGADLRGRVRLSAPTTYGHFRLPPMLRSFAELHPNVEIEVSISNRNVDLAAEGFDLAIRLGNLPDSTLIGRRLEDAPVSVAASPGYLERMGEPATVDDLVMHRCLGFVLPSTGRIIPWIFRQDGVDFDWTPSRSLQVSDDVLGTVSLAIAGLGICQLYDFIVDEKVARGELVEILTPYRGRSRPFSLLYPPQKRLSAAARALIEHIATAARR